MHIISSIKDSRWLFIYLFIYLSNLQLSVESVSITTKVVSLNPVHGEVYSIQHYVITFVSDLRQVGGFLHQYNWPPRYNWNIVESGAKQHNSKLSTII